MLVFIGALSLIIS